MEIESKTLQTFIKKASLDGSIMSMHMNFLEDGVHSKLMDSSQIALTETFLKKEAFIVYEPLGNIFIKDSNYILEMLKSFTSTVIISKETDYMIKFSKNNRNAYIMLAEASICSNVFTNPTPVIELCASLNITKTEMSPFIKDLKTLKINVIKFSGKDNIVTVQVGEEDEIDYTKTTFEMNEGSRDFLVKIGATFESVYNILTEKCVISFGTERPVVIQEITDFISFSVMIAPLQN